MNHLEAFDSPLVRLGDVSDDSVAVSIYVLVRHGVTPATRRGRQAIARLADGRVDFDGPPALARNLLRLLAVDASSAARRRHTSATCSPRSPCGPR